MLGTSQLSYPILTRSERIADGTIHVLGVAAALLAVGGLLYLLSDRMAWGTLTGVLIYCATLILMLGASAAYHLAAYTPARPMLRRLDHAAIYIKIAGTFTPLSVALGTGFGYVILGLVWVLALIGAGTKLMAARGRMSTGWLPYLALGWIGVALFVPLFTVLSGLALSLIVAGGLLYTVGIVFYRWQGLRYATAVWHAFILAASACFFAGISTAVGTMI